MPSQQEQIKATFARWDTDNSGHISKAELFAVFKTLDPTFMDIELEAMMEEADLNQDGKIDINEFVEWCTAENSEMVVPMGELWEERLKIVKHEALRKFKGWTAKLEKHFTATSGRLGSDAFKKTCVDLFMKSQDDNNDGLIDYVEVKDMIEPTLEMLYANDVVLKKKKLQEADIKAAFDAHDTQDAGKGKMGAKEFVSLMQYLQVIACAAMMNDTVAMWEDQDA